MDVTAPARNRSINFWGLFLWRPCDLARRFQPHRLRQLRLPLVERPEPLRLQLQCASHVQSIQRAYPERRPVLSRQFRSDPPRRIRKARLDPNAPRAIFLEGVPKLVSVSEIHLRPEHVPINRVREFGAIQRRQPNGRCVQPAAIRLPRIRIGDITRDQKTRVDANTQNRSSRISSRIS